MMCPICRSDEVKTVQKYMYDDRYGYPETFEVYKCSPCNHAFINTSFTDSQISDLYSKYYPRSSFKVESFHSFKVNKGFKEWFEGEKRSAYKWVPPKVKVLDIGCGLCQTLDYHKSRGCDVWGVEADQNVSAIAEAKGFKVKIGLFNKADFEKGYFDFVTLDQVLEHFQDPVRTLEDIRYVVRSNGNLIISIPNFSGIGRKIFGKKWIHWHLPYHIQFFSKKSISKTLTQSGFEIISIRSITSSEWLFYQFLHLIEFPKLGEPSLFWAKEFQGSKLSQKILLRAILLMHKFKLFHIITRVFDLLGTGDNLIIVAKRGL